MASRSSPEDLEAWIEGQKWGETVSKSTLYRMKNAESGVGADSLALVARAFGLPAWQLLHPDFDARKPFVAFSEEAIETEVERRVRERLKAVEDVIGGLHAEGERHDGRSAAKPFGDLKAPTGEPGNVNAAEPQAIPAASAKKSRKR